MDAVDPDNTEAVTTEKEKEAMKEEPAPVGTRQWAESVDYDAAKVFDKVNNLDFARKNVKNWLENRKFRKISMENWKKIRFLSQEITKSKFFGLKIEIPSQFLIRKTFLIQKMDFRHKSPIFK